MSPMANFTTLFPRHLNKTPFQTNGISWMRRNCYQIAEWRQFAISISSVATRQEEKATSIFENVSSSSQSTALWSGSQRQVPFMFNQQQLNGQLTSTLPIQQMPPKRFHFNLEPLLSHITTDIHSIINASTNIFYSNCCQCYSKFINC